MGKIVKRLYQAIKYSYDGLKATFKHEWAFRIEVIAIIPLIPLSFYIGETWIERSLLIVAIVFIALVEIINSAIESTIDRISLEKNPLSKQAKDQGSAAVLIALIIAILIWSGVVLDNF